jgi:hypothetical protein
VNLGKAMHLNGETLQWQVKKTAAVGTLTEQKLKVALRSPFF